MAVENRLTAIEERMEHLKELGQQTVDLQKTANGRVAKLEGGLQAHLTAHLTRESYDRGVTDGQATLSKLDFAKLATVVSLVAGAVTAVAAKL